MTLRQVVTSAQLVRDVQKKLKLSSRVKTTGGRGLHVVVPVTPVPTRARISVKPTHYHNGQPKAPGQ